MKTDITEMKYCLYARKSSESDERQAMSIDSQIKEMMAMADREGLDVVEVKKESFSAKQSGYRPIFNELMHGLRNGSYNAILTWAPDRLSRNAGDLGSLVDLMDMNKLQRIRTYAQSFSNTPNEKFLLMILCSQAKLENVLQGRTLKLNFRVIIYFKLGFLQGRTLKLNFRVIICFKLGWRDIATSCSSACFQNEQANFDKLRYAEFPELLLAKVIGVSDPSSLVIKINPPKR